MSKACLRLRELRRVYPLLDEGLPLLLDLVRGHLLRGHRGQPLGGDDAAEDVLPQGGVLLVLRKRELRFEFLFGMLFLPAERRSKSCMSCWGCCCYGGSSLLVPFIYHIVVYFGFIKSLWGGILDPQFSASFLLIDFCSMNSLQGGIPQKFPFNLSSCVHCLPKWTKSMPIPQVFEQKSVLVFFSLEI